MTGTGQLWVAGLGPGDQDLITPQVQAALAAATDVVGYFPYVERVPERPNLRRHASDNRQELARAQEALALAADGRQVVVVSSGDPGVFAMAAAVFEAIENGPSDWRALTVEVLPGISAMLAASARAGAPLGHDFCCLNLSDNLKPWSIIERRLQLAAEADLAMAFYNPRSKARPEGFARALATLRSVCEPERCVILARAVSTPEEQVTVTTLAEVVPEQVDMRTLVLIGSSQTRVLSRLTGDQPWVYTPRQYHSDVKSRRDI
ncbi:precorrin-3B C(17)-methyltransferase [Terasakiispira papahanaumokuakeensis]|uniref:Precorrin-3B C(17)-methyltransferase n=1 Tax=Terasakiispira papahanaumokuakeensis TaxID=197479 RepID=A0A1E2VC96_9GAMM|nr:precorrin-3B C(17)-methyltransferase [Terasakiispira papahanaumokuakeensis]ODC04601.1 precorrin-3B C(17)-methyltransferase [Terasakiispira papahanaumokuakeensis]